MRRDPVPGLSAVGCPARDGHRPRWRPRHAAIEADAARVAARHPPTRQPGPPPPPRRGASPTARRLPATLDSVADRVGGLSNMAGARRETLDGHTGPSPLCWTANHRRGSHAWLPREWEPSCDQQTLQPSPYCTYSSLRVALARAPGWLSRAPVCCAPSGPASRGTAPLAREPPETGRRPGHRRRCQRWEPLGPC